MNQSNVGRTVSVLTNSGERVEGWVYAETSSAIYVALDDDAHNIRYIPSAQGQTRRYFHDAMPPVAAARRSAAAAIEELEASIDSSLPLALNRIDQNQLRRIRSKLAAARDKLSGVGLGRSSEQVQSTLVVRSVEIYQELLDELIRSGLVAQIAEHEQVLRQAINLLAIPQTVSNRHFLSAELVSFIDSVKEKASLSEADFGRRLLDQINAEGIFELDATRPGGEEASGSDDLQSTLHFRLGEVAAGLEIAVGGSLVAEGVILGGLDGVLDTLPTLGHGWVSTEAGILTLTYAGLQLANQGLREMVAALDYTALEAERWEDVEELAEAPENGAGWPHSSLDAYIVAPLAPAVLVPSPPSEALPMVGPKDEAATRQARVRRYGRLDLPEQVPVKKPFILTVTINREKVGGSSGQEPELHLDAVEWPLSVLATLKVNPDELEIQGSNEAWIEVPCDGDSQPVNFSLIPLNIGKKTVRIKFEQGGKYLCTAFHSTEVVEGEADYIGKVSSVTVGTLSASSSPPSWTIYVEQKDGWNYAVSVHDAKNTDQPAQEIDRIKFGMSPEEYMEVRFKDLADNTSKGLLPAKFDEAVKDFGTRLFEDLFHKDGFEKFFWEKLYPAEGLAVQIVSEEPWIPWEILRATRRKPDGTTECDRLFFCERFAMSRWLEVEGDGPAGLLQMGNITVVAPPANLQYVEVEITSLRDFWPSLKPIVDKDALEDFFTAGRADIVHFACHGKFQSTDPARSEVKLGGQSLWPAEVTAEKRNFGRDRPLVFLNACASGRVGVGLTGVDGWVRAFLEANAGSFVGSLWDITDERASLFAIEFYRNLRQGIAIAEALRRARNKVKSSGDATYLSYTLYGDPLATFVSASKRGSNVTVP